MNVISATVSQVKAHPAIYIGGLIGVVAIGYLLTRGSGSNAQSMTFVGNIGPSDAAIQSSAAIQIAQIQTNGAVAQTTAQYDAATDIAKINGAVSIQAGQYGVDEAQIAAGVATSQQMYGYQTVLSNNVLASHVSDNETELGINGQNTSAQVQMQQQQLHSNDIEQLQSLNHDTQTQVIARNAAETGSLIYETTKLNDQFNDQFWSAIQSGQSSQTLDEMRSQFAQQVGNLNSLVPTSGLWQTFAG